MRTGLRRVYGSPTANAVDVCHRFRSQILGFCRGGQTSLYRNIKNLKTLKIYKRVMSQYIGDSSVRRYAPVQHAWTSLSNAIIVLRRLIAEAWTNYRWDARPVKLYDFH